MQVYDAYPARAVGGACFITKNYDLSGGQRVVSLDIDLSNQPMTGLVCISEEGVRQMNVALGWIADEQGAQNLADARAEVELLRAKVTEQEAALAAISQAFTATGTTTSSASTEWEVVPVEPTTTDEQFVVTDPEPPAKPAKKPAAKRAAKPKP